MSSPRVEELSVAQMQLVEVARALATRAADPAAGRTDRLDHAARNGRPLQVLRRLRDQGVAMVFVSHKLEEVFELCDRVTVLT